MRSRQIKAYVHIIHANMPSPDHRATLFTPLIAAVTGEDDMRTSHHLAALAVIALVALAITPAAAGGIPTKIVSLSASFYNPHYASGMGWYYDELIIGRLVTADGLPLPNRTVFVYIVLKSEGGIDVMLRADAKTNATGWFKVRRLGAKAGATQRIVVEFPGDSVYAPCSAELVVNVPPPPKNEGNTRAESRGGTVSTSRIISRILNLRPLLDYDERALRPLIGIAGRLVDDEGRALPARRITIMLTLDDDIIACIHAITDDNGSFVVEPSIPVGSAGMLCANACFEGDAEHLPCWATTSVRLSHLRIIVPWAPTSDNATVVVDGNVTVSLSLPPDSDVDLVLPSGSYTITMSWSWLPEPLTERVTLNGSAVISAPSPVRVAVRVLDASGAPLPGAVVEARRGARVLYRASTFEGGTAILILPQGRCILNVTYPPTPCVARIVNLTVTDEESITVSLPLIRELIIRVYDSKLRPIDGARLSVMFRNSTIADAVTDCEGKAIVRDAPAGRMRIIVEYLGFTYAVTANATPGRAIIICMPLYDLRIRLVSMLGLPVKHEPVKIVGPVNVTVCTDDRGIIELDRLPRGTYVVKARGSSIMIPLIMSTDLTLRMRTRADIIIVAAIALSMVSALAFRLRRRKRR